MVSVFESRFREIFSSFGLEYVSPDSGKHRIKWVFMTPVDISYIVGETEINLIDVQCVMCQESVMGLGCLIDFIMRDSSKKQFVKNSDDIIITNIESRRSYIRRGFDNE